MHSDGRAFDEIRPVKITRQFTAAPAGSVLWQQGGTMILCTASVSAGLPDWFSENRAGGWITADYVMLPGSTSRRKSWPSIGHTDSRGTEIQRIIGRSLRAAVDLSKIGPHTIALDCQVLQADGGTRTASICAAYIALVDAVAKLPREFPMPAGNPSMGAQPTEKQPNRAAVAPDAQLPARFNPLLYDPSRAVINQIAAISAGYVDGKLLLDLDYRDDSRAEVDMNVAYTAGGKFVDIQGSAENGGGFDRATTLKMLDLAVTGCEKLFTLQRNALAAR